MRASTTSHRAKFKARKGGSHSKQHGGVVKSRHAAGPLSKSTGKRMRKRSSEF